MPFVAVVGVEGAGWKGVVVPLGRAGEWGGWVEGSWVEFGCVAGSADVVAARASCFTAASFSRSPGGAPYVLIFLA